MCRNFTFFLSWKCFSLMICDLEWPIKDVKTFADWCLCDPLMEQQSLRAAPTDPSSLDGTTDAQRRQLSDETQEASRQHEKHGAVETPEPTKEQRLFHWKKGPVSQTARCLGLTRCSGTNSTICCLRPAALDNIWQWQQLPLPPCWREHGDSPSTLAPPLTTAPSAVRLTGPRAAPTVPVWEHIEVVTSGTITPRTNRKISNRLTPVQLSSQWNNIVVTELFVLCLNSSICTVFAALTHKCTSIINK